jgi:hypothetical protein
LIASFSVQHAPTSEYLSRVAREEELTWLRNQVKARKSLLVFGPEGVGKSRLLRSFVENQPLALYIDQIRSPHDFLLALLDALHSAARAARIPANFNTLSTTSLKGVAQRALDTQPFMMVLDQLNGPSRMVTGLIKDLHHYGRTPVIFASRSPHMEDIGTLQPLCADKSERLELKNWPQHIALEFAHREAEKGQLSASNLESALHMIVEWSDGNPAAILHMVRMVQLPRYRLDDQIKAHVLYLDYLMGRR